MDTDEKLLAAKGWLLVDGTGSVTVKHYGVSIRENTVVSIWTASTVDGTTIDLKKHFGITGRSLIDKDPALLIPDEWINNPMVIKLDSGSVNVLRSD